MQCIQRVFNTAYTYFQNFARWSKARLKNIYITFARCKVVFILRQWWFKQYILPCIGDDMRTHQNLDSSETRPTLPIAALFYERCYRPSLFMPLFPSQGILTQAFFGRNEMGCFQCERERRKGLSK